MPKDNIERAIKKGTGELEGVVLEEIVYEGYGAGGVAVMVNTVTDNRNRTSGEVKKIFERHGGSIGRSGCVAWQFETKAFVLVDASAYDEDAGFEAAVEGGADDVCEAGASFEITGPPENLEQIRRALAGAGIEFQSADVTNLATTTVTVPPDKGSKALRLLQALDDHDDVESTDTNLEVTDELLAAVEGDEQ